MEQIANEGFDPAVMDAKRQLMEQIANEGMPTTAPTLTQQQTAEQTPGYQDLGWLEQKMYSSMPAVSDWFSGVGDWFKDKLEFDINLADAEPIHIDLLENPVTSFVWNNIAKPLGGLGMGLLDVGAEAIERTIGLAVQYSAALDPDNDYTVDEFNDNLANAWYAGAMFADTAHLPKIMEQDDGTWKLELPTGKAGAEQSYDILQVQDRIDVLVEQGYKRGDALIQARDEYYNSKEALAFRATLHDAMFHILADPLNIVLPMLKPVDRLHEFAISLRAQEAVGGVADFNKWEKFAFNVTGGLVNAPKSKWDWLPWRLTPESKAYEYLTTCNNRMGVYALSKFDEPLDTANAIAKFADDIAGPQFGHALTSIEGRMVQGASAASAEDVMKLAKAYEKLAKEGIVDWLEQAGKLIDKDATHIVGQIKNKTKRAALLKKLEDAGMDMSKVSDDVIKRISKLDDMKAPYTKELFKHRATQVIMESVEEMAVLKFGVESRGLLLKASAALKSAETLAFLRTNVGFAMKNFINNELTMIARGVGGLVNDDDLLRIVDSLGFEPLRMAKGYTQASGEIFQVGGKSAIAKASRGDVKGAKKMFDQIGEWINGLEFGPEVTIKGEQVRVLDMGSWASFSEKKASARAFYNGYNQGLPMFWKPVKGFTPAKEALGDLGFSDDVLKGVDDVIAGSGSVNEINDGLRNGKVLAGTILQEVEQNLGVKLDDIFSGNELGTFKVDMNLALEKGPAAIRSTVNEVRQRAADTFKLTAEANAGIHAEKIAKWVEFGGINGVAVGLGDIVDELAGAQLADGMRMMGLDVPPAGMGRSEFWETMMGDREQYWKLVWDNVEESITGMKKGAGDWFPEDIETGMKNVRKVTEDYFKGKQKRYNTFFDARDAGKKPPLSWDEIQKLNSEEYYKLIDSKVSEISNIDSVIADMIGKHNPDLYDDFVNWRSQALMLQRNDMVETAVRMDYIKTVPFSRQPEEYSKLFVDKFQNTIKQWEQERTSIAKIREILDQPRLGATYTSMRGEAGWDALDDAGQLAYINTTDDAINYAKIKYLDEQKTILGADSDEFLKIDKLPDDLPPLTANDITDNMRKAAKKQYIKANPATPDIVGHEKFYADVRKITESSDAMHPPWTTYPQYHYQRKLSILDDLQAKAVERYKKPNFKWDDMTPEQAVALEKHLKVIEGQMSDAQYAAIKYGEYKRDSALLNYSRKHNYNSWLGVMAPYEFWTTKSAMKWAVHSIDRPAMLSTYLRMKDFIHKAGNPGDGFPSRLSNHIKISLPFMPEWMGNDDIYIDPLRFALPFDNWGEGVGDWIEGKNSAEAKAERYIQNRISDGTMDSKQGLEAISARSGEIWENAVSMTVDDDDTSFWDTMAYIVSPHPFAKWAWHYATGEKEEIGRIPLATDIKQIAGAFGVNPANEKWGIVGNVRESLGLHAYDQWDTYRVERMVTNMIATGDVTLDEGMRALIEHKGPAWEDAMSRAAKEFSGGQWTGTALKLLGIPTQTYPEGEMLQRGLQDEFIEVLEMNKQFEKVWGDAYGAGGDPTLLKQFFDENPEYEARLALFDTPEERMRQFLVDEIWNKYYEIPKVDRDILGDHFGDTWNNLFMNKETRNYESIPINDMQMWLKVMGGDPPGTLSDKIEPIEFAPPDIAKVSQDFYDYRDENFPNYNEYQNEFFELETQAEKDAYLLSHRELREYWDWRGEFLHNNPDIVPYVTDEDGMRQFITSEIWDIYMDMPKVHKDQVKEALGPTFETFFVDKENRDYSNISLETMQSWLKSLGGTPPGGLNIDVMPVILADSDIAWLVEQYYDLRKKAFPDFYDIQTAYYDEPEGAARRAYLSKHPELKEYWDWRNDFFHRNPDVVPYVSTDYDMDYLTEAHRQEAVAEQPTLTRIEYNTLLGTSTVRAIEQNNIPRESLDYLTDMAEKLGMTLDEFLRDVLGSQ